ncbi:MULTISPECIES: GTP pyrophosphokinase [Metabacillus]|uniref:GTP pyrophosphokinase family protein n=1 Tax=Metabacillus halosaccharovorans TaxID=930124 RepID=A0ABT3DP55_9BACI|nr:MULTISPECIES: GTP pyrophosphokinase family protein [Metabacillus]MBU7591048.1 GTP pyrophosphokinase family protein [Metabacillus halosaccharovorans]MCV9888814.1 GTP pyrophosphokinase family protein [Metabacillus halosaccharovorans]
MEGQQWKAFLAPYNQAVEELKVKLRGIRSQYELEHSNSPIEFVTGRVKPIASILDKAKRKNIAMEDLEEGLQDIAGVRMMCQFVDDIRFVVNMLKNRNDLEIIEERDYITNQKDSGYRSYHLVARYPVQTIAGEKKLLVEIQIRTLSMNFWATIEHSLNYKYSGNIPDNIKVRLKRAAEAAYSLDEEMSQIRGEIQEAQAIFSRKTDKK